MFIYLYIPCDVIYVHCTVYIYIYKFMFLFACTVLFVVVYLAEVRSTLVDCQFPVQPMDVLEMVEFQDTGLQGGGGGQE